MPIDVASPSFYLVWPLVSMMALGLVFGVSQVLKDM